MTIFNSAIPNGTLGYLLQTIKRLVDWGPTSAPETEARLIDAINAEAVNMAIESPWLTLEHETSIPLEPDFYSTDSGVEEDVVERHESDPFVLTRPVHEDLDDWPSDGEWNSRWITITNEADVSETRRIRDVWVDDSVCYMTVDRALTITGDVLDFAVKTIRYPLPHGTISLGRPTVSRDDLRQSEPQQVAPRRSGKYAYDGDTAESRRNTLVAPGALHWTEGPVEQLPAPPAALTSELSADYTWVGPDLPGTFEYAVVYAWGVYAGTSRLDESATRRPTPKYMSSPSASSAALATSAAGQCIKVYLPDVAWLAGWGEHALTTSTTDVRWAHTGIMRYVYRRRTTTATPNTSHRNSAMQKHVPADGSWRLWRCIKDETTQYIYDTGELPLVDDSRKLSTGSTHKTIIPTGDTGESTELHLQLRLKPRPMFGTSDTLEMKEEAVYPLAERVAISFAGTQGRNDVVSRLSVTYNRSVNAARPSAQGVATQAVSRRMWRRGY
jgi:hypothetical protein